MAPSKNGTCVLTDHSHPAAVFTGAEHRIRKLRLADPVFDEACGDFEEISEILQRLSASEVPDQEAREIASTSLDELKTELTERLAIAEKLRPNGTRSGEKQ